MIPGSANPLLLKSAAAGGYQVSRSLRFSSNDSAYLSRTYSSAPVTRTKGTIAFWVKRAALGSDQWVFDCYDGGSAASSNLKFRSDNAFEFQYGGGAAYSLITTQVFRDASAWYHFCFVLDSTQATASNRVKMYVNGVQVTTFSTANYPAQNASHLFTINTASNRIGCRQDAGAGTFLSAYLADFHWLDGIAASGADAFTEVSATTGQLIPLAYSGTFGANGFWLKFSDNSAATAATLGKDYSGNSNNWTPNNLSVTAGAGNDSLVDTPTSISATDTGVGGEIRGNYCTWNPLDTSGGTLTNGNLDLATGTATYGGTRGTVSVSSGKWYWEVTPTAMTTSGELVAIGICASTVALPSYAGSGTLNYTYMNDGQKRVPGSDTNYGATYTVNDVIGVALDLDAGTLVFYKNGASQGTAFSSLSGSFAPYASDADAAQSCTVVANFGQRAFAYPLSGFKALCDTNLPAPLTAKPNTLMDVALWTGTGATNAITGLGFSPDLVWIKKRSAAADHNLVDSVRVGTRPYLLYPNLTNAENTSYTLGVQSLDSAGFTLGTDGDINGSGATYAGWCWDAGTSTVSNTAGSITSQVRANPTAGFSVVTWTGNGGTNATVGHGLGVAPQFISAKWRGGTSDWEGYHIGAGATKVHHLNTTDIQTLGHFGSTTPTGSVFTVNANGTGNEINGNGQSYVAYCFAPVVEYSNGFSYTGNGSADGSFVYLGFRPRLIMLKRSDSTSNWTLLDTSREGYNVDNDPLYPNLSDAEGTTDLLDITSNGFKLRSTDASVNASAGTYIGFAWAEAPFAYSRAR